MSELSATPDPRLYRRIIDWERRLAAEGPRLLAELGLGPGARLLDLGCGSGEHDRWLAARGVSVVGVDRSPEMCAAAREAAAAEADAVAARLEVVEAPIEALPATLAGPFDAALCLGNTFVHLLDAAAVDAFLDGVAARLRPGGRLLVQILNYTAITAERRRAFPAAFRPGEAGAELVFLRFMDHGPRASGSGSAPRASGSGSAPPASGSGSAPPASGSGSAPPASGSGSGEPVFVGFEAVVLERHPERPTRILDGRRSRLRAWTDGELAPRFAARLGPTRLCGGIDGSAYDPARSTDLVLIAERAPAGGGA